MVKIDLYSKTKKIPYIIENINITYQGKLSVEDKNIDINVFNKITGLGIKDIRVLLLVTFQHFRWPPVYWKDIQVLEQLEDTNTPENLIAGLKEPIESKEYPGFFMVPYFTNYVISPNGILIKRSNGAEIKASKGVLGYYTFRMTGDDDRTQNQLRHRILCLAFKEYSADVDNLDVNHRNGKPGDDKLNNLEWATRSENMLHAYANGLRNDNRPVQVKDSVNNRIYILESCSAAGRAFGVTETTISNRCKTNGFKSFDGFQFRFHPNHGEWPNIDLNSGNYLIEFPDGTSKRCSSKEAAKYVGVTPSSLTRLLREGRSFGTTENKVTRLTI